MTKTTLEQLKALNVVKFTTYHVNEVTPFSYHFFNNDGLEVAYFIVGFLKLCGLQVLPAPRKWSETALASNTPLTDIKHITWGN